MAPDKDKALRMLGLATRARKTVSGATACEKAVIRGNARLILIAEDAADDTRERMTRLCNNVEVPCRVAGTGEILGQYTGKDLRMTVGILDQGFADRIRELLDESDT